jgi:hypothetical protein
MNEYRNPRERQAQDEQEARIRKVIDQAVADSVSCSLAMHYGESPEVVEGWVDKVWDGLRDNLSDDLPDRAGLRVEDRLTAIMILLEDRIATDTDALLRALEDPS